MKKGLFTNLFAENIECLSEMDVKIGSNYMKTLYLFQFYPLKYKEEGIS